MPSKMPGQWRVFRFERADGNYFELASNHMTPDEISIPAPGYKFVSATPMVPQEYADDLDGKLRDEKFAHEDTLVAAKAAHIRAEKAEEALRALDEALDDLPRYMAVSQPAEGWMPALGAQPVLTACVSVDHARAMLTQAASTPQSQQTAGPTEGE